jgi:hypothetical protein
MTDPFETRYVMEIEIRREVQFRKIRAHVAKLLIAAASAAVAAKLTVAFFLTVAETIAH